MRAIEFMSEAKQGRIPKRHSAAQPGGYRFMDDGTDRIYNLNRIMMAAAKSDGSSSKPLKMNGESFAGKHNMAYPYTELEHNMMKQAFATINPTVAKEFIGDHGSKELDDTHKISPIKSRRDYRKK